MFFPYFYIDRKSQLKSDIVYLENKLKKQNKKLYDLKKEKRATDKQLAAARDELFKIQIEQ